MTDDYIRFREFFKERKYTEALGIAEAQLEGGASAFWLTQQARVLNRKGKYLPALKVAEQALSLEPANSYALLAVADACFGLNRLSDALEYYREALANARVTSAAGKKVLECLSRLKKWQEILDMPTTRELSDDIFFPYKVKALEGLKRPEEALAECEEWVKKQPDNPQAVRALIELEVRQQGAQAVLDNLARMLRIPSLAPVYREVYIALCEKNGRMDEARRELAALQAQSSDPWVQRRNAFNLAKSGRESEALPLLEEFMRDDPEDRYLHASYLAACRRTGVLPRARDFYFELLKLHPEAKSLLGRIKKIKSQLPEGGDDD